MPKGKTKKKTIKKAVLKKGTTSKPKTKKAGSLNSRGCIKVMKKKTAKKSITKKKRIVKKSVIKNEKKIVHKKIAQKRDKIVLFDDINVATIKARQDEHVIENSIEENENNMVITNDVLSLDQESQSKQLNIKISNLNTKSPHLVDLKKRRIVTYIDQEKDRPKTLEDRLASFEDKFYKTKTNFITPEAVKYARKNRQRKTGKIKRIFLVIKGNISNFFENRISKVGIWGDELVTNYLEQKSNRGTESDLSSQIIIEQVRKNKIKRKHSKFFSFPHPVRWTFSSELRGSLFLFLILAIVLVSPLKAYTFYEKVKNEKSQVLGVSSTVYKDFSNGVDALSRLNFSEATNNFTSASENLLSVRQVLNEYPAFLMSAAKSLPKVGSHVSAGDILIDVGNNIANAGALMSQLFAEVLTEDDKLTSDRLVELKTGFQELSVIFKNTSNLLIKIDEQVIPEEYQEKISLLKQWMPLSSSIIDNIVEVLDISIILLGHDQPQRYLIVFQNSNELRPTGGFIGSFAEIDVDKAQVTNIIIPTGGIYDLQGDLEVLVAAPKPLHMLNANWQIQDSNWWFDFPTSAKKILWFYEKSGGPTVDGLIAVNSNILSSLISITGPIYLANFDITLDENNIINEIQKEVEFNYDKENNEPKKIISELMPIMIEKLQKLSGNQFMEIFTVFNSALTSKDIQIYYQNDEMQKKLKELAWTGDVKYTKQDYLAVVNTNIGGGKADNKINQQTHLQTVISEDGSIRNKLKIRYDYTGALGELFIEPEYNNYLRVYVPLGSRMITTNGFYVPASSEFNSPREGYEIDEYLHEVEKLPIVEESTNTRITEEFGKTVFGNWVKLIPGETKEVYIEYELPFKVTFKDTKDKNIIIEYFDKLIEYIGISLPEEKQVATYTAMWQKQSGQVAPFITHELNYSNNWDVASSPSLYDKIARQENKVYYQTELDRDIFWGVILSK